MLICKVNFCFPNPDYSYLKEHKGKKTLITKYFSFPSFYYIMLLVMKMDYIQYGVILVVFLIILLAVLKSMKKDAHLELNKLVEYLGGKDNILSTETSLSRFKVTLKDVSLVNKEAIQKLGAKGIVEIDNQLKIILGSESKQLKKYIDNLK